MPNLLNTFGRTCTHIDISGYIVLNMSGAQKFEEDIVYPRGKYSIEVIAGSTFCGNGLNSPYTKNGLGVGGKVSTEVTIYEPFLIRAYCGSKGNYGIGGTNPYSGSFKVNAQFIDGVPPAVDHIFGNVGGSAAINSQGHYYPGSGNCLGNGIGVEDSGGTKYGVGAGSCLHFLPINGIFGRDYLFAAHCGPAATGWYGQPITIPGNGGVYGGGSGGISVVLPNSGYVTSVYNGGSTNFGNGGIGVKGNNYNLDWTQADGTGIGAGNTYPSGSNPLVWFPRRGAAALFKDGLWQTSNEYGETETNGMIKVVFLEPL